MIALAVDLGGSHAACAVVQDDKILASRSLPVNGRNELRRLLPLLGGTLRELAASAELRQGQLSALVFGFCGVVNPREKRVAATNGKFADATGMDLCAWCAGEFGLPLLLENDARLALLGEYAYGAARHAEDVVMITLGSGVGGAALLNGRLLQSKHGLAGTIGGHLPVVLDGRLCSCGNLGCAEAEASTAVLSEIYSNQSGSERGALCGLAGIGFAQLFAAADAGDQPAKDVLERCMRVWSALTVSLIHAYDPEVVVFGGSVLQRAADILPRLQEYVLAHAWTQGRSLPLRAAALGSNAALLGAIPLIESSR